jgi:deoxycytidylate deaminase
MARGTQRIINPRPKLGGLFNYSKWDDPTQVHRHRSALVKGGKILVCSEPTLGGVPDICRERGRSCHAEMNLIKQYSGTFKSRKMAKYEVWIVRWDKQGNLVNSQPCLHCRNSLLALGIHRIVFSNKQGSFVKADLRDLDTCKLSSGARY